MSGSAVGMTESERDIDAALQQERDARDAAPFHFYATNAYGWAVGRTRTEAIRKLAGDVGATTLKNHVKGKGKGLYVWTCRVALPLEAHYRIENYRPSETPDGKIVGLSQVQEFRIITTRGAVLPND